MNTQPVEAVIQGNQDRNTVIAGYGENNHWEDESVNMQLLTSGLQKEPAHVIPRADENGSSDFKMLFKLRGIQMVNVEWKNLTYTISEGYIYKCKRKTILNGISGEVVSGEMTAVMGPSGAGKSTLMNILTGYIKKEVKGEILTNNTQRELSSFRRLSSYVMQDDFLLPQLTVKEILTVAANLKIPCSIPVSCKELVVSEIIVALGLKDCANTKACQISGGERKRLAIGQELVNNPSIIFLDEPTRDKAGVLLEINSVALNRNEIL